MNTAGGVLAAGTKSGKNRPNPDAEEGDGLPFPNVFPSFVAPILFLGGDGSNTMKKAARAGLDQPIS